MSRFQVPRQQSLMTPEIVNPFVHRLQLTWLDKLQIVLMTVTLVPLRLLLIVFCLMIAWGLARIALVGRTKEDEKKPMKGWRNALRPLVVAASRAVFFVGGFHWITTKGKLATATEAPVLAAAPHSTFFDALPITFLNLTSVVAKSDVALVPFFGTLTRFTQPVFVSREDPNSRVNTIKEITSRAHSGGEWPQVIIFPEGTCTNRSCLISFKPGAFYPGVPVQPVLFRYGNKLDTVTWTWEGISGFQVLWYSMCQFHVKLEIEYLPVYYPSEEEKNDARLYARNVRAVMAEALGVPETDHTYEDIRLMNYAAKLELPAASGLVEFAKLNRKLGMNFDNMKELLEKFCGIAQSSAGHVSMEDFAKYLGMPMSDALEALFKMYDRNGSGSIDFREYVIGLSLVAMPANNEETIQLAFHIFDTGGKGYITATEFAGILQNAFGMNEEDSKRIFHQVDADQDDRITYDEFKAYAELRPEYASLFSAYNELQSMNQNGCLLSGETQDNGVLPTASQDINNHNDTKSTSVTSVTSPLEPEPRDHAKVKSA